MRFKPGSVLIMDVTASSAFPNPLQLSEYLSHAVTLISTVGKETGISVSALHRRGDEVFVVAQGYATAYIIMFWLRMLWPFAHFPVYGGIGYGDLGTSVPPSEKLESWNSIIAKYAREAIDTLKQRRQANRQWVRFHNDHGMTQCNLLNDFVDIQDRFLANQSQVEREACFVNLLEAQKKSVASILQKDISTVSRQIKNANLDLILVARKRIVELLEGIEQQDDESQISSGSHKELDNRSALLNLREPSPLAIGLSLDKEIQCLLRPRLPRILTDLRDGFGAGSNR